MNYKYLFLGVVSLAALSCVREPATDSGICPGREPEAVADDGSVISGWIRIKLQEDAAPLKVGVFTRGEADSGNPELDRAAAALGATEIRRSFSDGGRFAERRCRYGFHLWYDIRFDEDVPVSRAQDGISSLPGVAHVQPIYRIVPLDNGRGIPGEMVYRPAAIGAARPSDEPFDDPGLPQQWHYNNEGSIRRAVEGADIDLFEAWKTTAGDPAVIVAIMDGGVQWDHPDLAANMWVNEAELNGMPGVDDDGNGYVDDIYGWNTMRESGEIAPNSHGTHVAGTVGAVNNNGIGVCGVAGGTGKGDGVRLMSCQIFSGDLTGDALVSSRAVKYAADHGASILQCSWGIKAGIYTSDNMFIKQSPMDYEALQYFAAQKNCEALDGGLIIFSAGNESTAMSGYPAGYRDYISVTSFSPDYLPANYTNYGSGCNIAAPGGETSGLSGGEKAGVLSTLCSETSNGADYGYMQGTSMACPHVSGVAALGLSYALEKGKRYSLDEFKTMLLTSVNEIDSRLGEGSKATIADVSIYRGKMGTGITDAYQLLMQIEGTPCLQVALGEVQLIPLTQHFGQGAEDLTYTDIQMSAKDMEKLGIKAAPKMYNGKLMIKCTKPGSAKIKVSAIAGGTKPGTGVVMGGMVITKEFAVIARSAGAANGGWL